MKKILVTGGCGFIGSELARQLIRRGYRVYVADDLSKPGSSVKPGYEFFKIDLKDKEKTNELFMEGFDVCFNLAAKVGGVGYLNTVPALMLSENNQIYSSTFEAAVKNNLGRMIFVSSSMALKGEEKSPYGFSKLIGEQYCYFFKKQYGLDYTICRPFNIYGINNFPAKKIGDSHVIPEFIKKTLQGGDEIEILGDGQQIRCFTHISDLVRGLIMIMENDKTINDDFNLSVKEETKIIDLAEKIWRLCGRIEPFKPKFVPGFEGDVKKRFPDISKTEEVLGWKAEINLDDGLKEVINWLKPYYEK